MKFSYLINNCELESKSNGERNLVYLSMIFDQLMLYINKKTDDNPEITMNEINKNINELVQNYLSKLSESMVRNKTIEYYLNNVAYSGGNNIRKVYDKVSKKLSKTNADKENEETEDDRYTYNMELNMERLIKAIIIDIRDKKSKLSELDEIEETMIQLRSLSSKERTFFIKRVIGEHDLPEEEKRGMIQEIENGYKLFFKSEIDIVEESFKQHTETARKEVKEDCIKCIRANIEFLDEFGFLEMFTKINNKNYKKVYINKAEITYEQLQEQLKEDNLKRLNIEELIILSSFWTNRVNKVIKDLNKALYIVNHRELIHKDTSSEEGKNVYKIEYEDMKNIDLKINVIHKLFFELYSDIEKNSSDKYVDDITEYIDKVCEKYEREYRKYFNKKFPKSKNDLEHDMLKCNIFENVRYNSYKIKDYNMQALLISLFNADKIENFGYIKEPEKKKEILIAADVKGFNMPMALHINKDLVKEFVQESNGNFLFPVYKNYDDFRMNENEVLKAQILVTLPKETDKCLEEAAKNVGKHDRYGKAVKHLNYLRRNGKMPEHMMKMENTSKEKKYKYVREYVDLNDIGNNVEKER